jgi:hypothetical protein
MRRFAFLRRANGLAAGAAEAAAGAPIARGHHLTAHVLDATGFLQP